MNGRAQLSPDLLNARRVAQGSFARKQLFSESAIIAWSHRSRFRTARRLLEPHAGGRFLDYGCGDGTLLAVMSDLFPDATGTDVDLGEIEDCRQRFAGLPTIRFLTLQEIAKPAHEGAYDVVSCMEVLEHCLQEDVDRVIVDLCRVVAPGGTVIISVPIEIGPTLVGKYLVRALAAWRSLGDYKYRERYSPAELLRMCFATERTAIPRDVHVNGLGQFHGHKGFNWRALRARLSRSFEMSPAFFSPLDRFGGLFSSQAWFICRPRQTD